MRQKHLIDAFKLASGPFVLLLIALTGRWGSPVAWLYLALHGGYGVLWFVEGRVFPDRSWEAPLTLWRGAQLMVGLLAYWVAPLLITLRGVEPPAVVLALATLLCLLGVFLHFVSDMQKHVALRLRAGELIDDGLFARLRNPNYFGELLIYLALALLPLHPLPPLLLAAIVALEWIPNMLRKDRSLARYPGFADYRARSWRFIPFVW